MARTLNKVMIIGNCANEPEIRAQQENYKLASLTVATNERKSNGQGGWTDAVEWHRIVLWNHNADYAMNYIHKGSKVYVEGRLRSNTYPDRNNPEIQHRTYEIVADTVILLDRRQDGAYAQDAAGQYSQQTQRPNGGWSNSAGTLGQTDGGYDQQFVQPASQVAPAAKATAGMYTPASVAPADARPYAGVNPTYTSYPNIAAAPAANVGQGAAGMGATAGMGMAGTPFQTQSPAQPQTQPQSQFQTASQGMGDVNSDDVPF